MKKIVVALLLILWVFSGYKALTESKISFALVLAILVGGAIILFYAKKHRP